MLFRTAKKCESYCTLDATLMPPRETSETHLMVINKSQITCSQIIALFGKYRFILSIKIKYFGVRWSINQRAISLLLSVTFCCSIMSLLCALDLIGQKVHQKGNWWIIAFISIFSRYKLDLNWEIGTNLSFIVHFGHHSSNADWKF